MITYVNTVFVGKGESAMATIAADGKITGTAGKFIVVDAESNAAATSTTNRFKIGLVTDKTTKIIAKDGSTTTIPVIKWSNVINKGDIKSYTYTPAADATEDTVTVTFTGHVSEVCGTGKGGKRIIVRLTFKDLPTRFRKWSESYEIVTEDTDTAATIATKLANSINKQYKRTRVTASAASGVLTLTAMPYDDDDSADSINWANKVRFTANVWYTDPSAAGFASKNKYMLGAAIAKTPGKFPTGAGKLVRDREAQAMGYEGILNRGEGTWPVISPAMTADITAKYNTITLEFENAYHTADDLVRKTKQTVEIYDTVKPACTTILETLVGNSTDANEIKIGAKAPVAG